MKIESVIQDDRQAKLSVEYSSEEFEGFKRRAAKRISKNAKIPGFRPGKAPYQVLVNHYGEGVIVQEAFDLLIEVDYSKMLEIADIEPSGSGSLETIENLDPPKFIVYIPLSPQVDLGEYREIRKAYDIEDFDKSSVDDYILNLRRNSATIIPAEHSAEVGDLVYFNLSGEFLNPEKDEDSIITDKTPQQVIIPDEGEAPESEWPYPGFSRMLLGVNAGDVKELEYTYLDDYKDEEFQGKTAIFTVDVQSVKALELPELDEDFLQTLGDFESPEDFRQKVEESLRTEHEENFESEYINALISEIIENSNLIYPPQMLEHEEEHVLEDIKSRLENQKLDFDTYLKLRNTDEETFIAEEVRPVAKQRLERNLVVDALIKAEGLTLDKEMLNQEISSIMNEIFRSGRAESLQKEMGNDEFSRMISMEGVSRTINAQLRGRLMLIGTGQPIPEPGDESEDELIAETADLAEDGAGEEITLVDDDSSLAESDPQAEASSDLPAEELEVDDVETNIDEMAGEPTEENEQSPDEVSKQETE